jgi:hypothetical protein
MFRLHIQYDYAYIIRITMNPLPREFEWEVSQAGYDLITVSPPEGADHEAGAYLVPIVPLGRYAKNRTYRPLDNTPALFRIFADTPPTAVGIPKFANEFGQLGHPTRISPPEEVPVGKYFWGLAESMDFWGAAISQMQDAIQLYDACQTEERALLSSRIVWDKNSVRYNAPSSPFKKAHPGFLIASDIWGKQATAAYKRGDLVAPALAAVRWIVRYHLQMYPMTLALFTDTRKPPFRFTDRPVPTSLLSALWVQLHYAIRGNKEYSECDQCGRWFEVTVEKRKDARFCSNACRFKAYRLRQKRAKQLHGEGMTFKQIALELGSDVEIVKGWIKQ